MTGIWLVSYIALWLLVLVMALVLLSVLRNLGVIYESMKSSTKLNTSRPLTALTTEMAVPEVMLQDTEGRDISLAAFRGR